MLNFTDLQVKKLDDNSFYLKTGRVERYRGKEFIKITKVKEYDTHFLTFDDVYIDVSEAEAQQIADCVGVQVEEEE